MKNIEEIENTILFDFNSKVLTEYKDNWNNSIPLYSVYKTYFNNDNFFYIYLGEDKSKLHKLSKINLPSVNNYGNELKIINFKKYELIKDNLIISYYINNFSTEQVSLIFKPIKCTTEEKQNIITVLKNKYEDKIDKIEKSGIATAYVSQLQSSNSSWITNVSSGPAVALNSDLSDLEKRVEKIEKVLNIK